MQAHNFLSSFAIENYKREVFRQKYYSDCNFLHHCTPVRRHPSRLLEPEVMLATCSIMWSKNTFPYLRLNFWGYGVFEHSLQNHTSYKPTFKQGKKVCRVTVVRCYDNLFFFARTEGAAQQTGKYQLRRRNTATVVSCKLRRTAVKTMLTEAAGVMVWHDMTIIRQ